MSSGICDNCGQSNELISGYIDTITYKYVCINGCYNNSNMLDYCQDCGRYGELRSEQACDDGCCEKFICMSICYYVCSTGHWTDIPSNSIHPDSYSCDHCTEVIWMDQEPGPYGGYTYYYHGELEHQDIPDQNFEWGFPPDPIFFEPWGLDINPPLVYDDSPHR